MGIEESTVLLVQPLSVQTQPAIITSYPSVAVISVRMLDTCPTRRAPRFGKENVQAL